MTADWFYLIGSVFNNAALEGILWLRPGVGSTPVLTQALQENEPS